MSGEYKIINKELDGLCISALTVENNEGKVKTITYSDAVKLARAGKIHNGRAVLDSDSGEYLLLLNNGISTLDTVYKSKNLTMTVTCRLIKGGKCVGYKAKGVNGKVYNLSIQKVWELASQGVIENIAGKINNNMKILVSTSEEKLIDLPELEIQ